MTSAISALPASLPPSNCKVDLLKLKRPALVLFGGVGILTFGGGIASFSKFYDYPFVASQAPQVVHAYRQAGLPWEAADIAQTPVVRDEDNAAILLKPLISRFTRSASKDRFAIDKHLKAGDWKVALTVLAPYSKSLSIVQEAAKRPDLDFRRDRDDLYSYLPIESAMSNMASLLSQRAEARAKAGRAAEALQDLQTSWDLAHLIAKDPSFHAARVKNDAKVAALRRMETCAAVWQADRRLLGRLAALLAKPMPETDWKAALQTDMYTGIASLRNTDFDLTGMYDEDQPSRPVQRTGLPQDVRARAYLVKSLRYYMQVARILEDHPKDIRAISYHMDKLGEGELGPKPLSETMHHPGLGYNLWLEECEVRARKAATHALVKALIAKLDTGRFHPPTHMSKR